MSQTMNITDPGFQIESPLPLPEDEVHLWRVDLETIGADELRWQQVLSSDELARAASFHFSPDRQCFIATRAWLRTILASYLRTDPHSLSFSYSKKRKAFSGASLRKQRYHLQRFPFRRNRFAGFYARTRDRRRYRTPSS